MTAVETIARNEAVIAANSEIIERPVACAWCQAWIKPPVNPAVSQQSNCVSHGICQECLAKERAKLEALRKQNLPQPVLARESICRESVIRSGLTTGCGVIFNP